MKLKMAYIGNEVLRKKAREVKNIDSNIKALISGMFKMMYAKDGIGLAAPQVGKDLRIFIADLSPYEIDFKIALINPEIVSFSQEKEIGEEGCLSIPGVYAPVERAYAVQIKGYTLDEKEVKIELEGFPARVVQHEIDHLDGVLFIDHVPKDKLPEYMEELQIPSPEEDIIIEVFPPKQTTGSKKVKR